jgi:hypothetical protein
MSVAPQSGRYPNPPAARLAKKGHYKDLVGNPVQRGHRFQRKADTNPVIADSG